MQRLKNIIARLRLRVKGYFLYFGVKVFSPSESILFERVRREGVFERDVCTRMQHLARSGTWFFDVGANLGLMSVPVLADNPNVCAVSIEPSPNSFPFLARTHANASFQKRWHVLSKAVSNVKGTTDFVLAETGNSAFEGMRDTQRVAMSRAISVEMAPLDDIWDSYGRPEVSLVKIDVEGAEKLVLEGASALINQCRPAIVMEWSLANLGAYGVSVEWLLDFASERQYMLFDLESLSPITRVEHLKVLCMQSRENFLLFPQERAVPTR